MPLTTCIFCSSYINVPNVHSYETSGCRICRRQFMLYKCYSCMGVSTLDPGHLPVSCPRCNTLVRGISGPISDILPPPSQRQNLLLIHNDNPALTSYTSWRTLNRLAFRGARVSYAELHVQGFAAIADGRFPMRTIIRDKWTARSVTTRMQTKSVLAWSKSFTKAFEYAFGSIQGGLSGAKPGNLYFGWIAQGVDVTAEVRLFEQRFHLPAIDEGTQKEILTPTLPKRDIVACWQIEKGRGFGMVRIVSKGVYVERPPETYEWISKMCPMHEEFDLYELCEAIDKRLG